MLSDFRHALRVLIKAPAFSALVIAILAVGIGATSTIFSVVDAVLLKPLPFPEPSRLVTVTSIVRGDEEDSSSYPDLQDWQAQTKTFTSLAGYFSTSLTLTGHGIPVSLQVAGTTSELFGILHVQPLIGRTLRAEDDRQPAAVAVISERLWSQRFQRRPVLGERLIIEGKPLTIVGVMPAAFAFPVQADPIDAWVPVWSVSLAANFAKARGAHFMQVLGRLAPGATLEQANADLSTITHRLAAEYPRSNGKRSARVERLEDRLVADYRLALLALIGAVAAVLLIACGNVANLLLVRATGRHREMAIRASLGAARWFLVRQVLVESVLLSMVAGALGVGLARVAIAATASAPFDVPRLQMASIDPRVLWFATALSVITGVVFGLAPALQLSAADAGQALKDAAHGTTGGSSARTRQLLVIAEVALSMMLLASAGLLIRSLVSLQRVDPGFVADRAIGTGMTMPETQFPDAPSQVAFARRLIETAGQVPGVTAAGISTTLPLTGSNLELGFDIEAQPTPPGERRSATYFAVSPDYFRAMGIRLVKGRAFTEHDDERASGVMVVSETMARRYWPAGDALGKRMAIGYNNTGLREIVGIVADVKNGSLTDRPEPSIYTPFAQTPWPMLGIVVRTRQDASAIITSLTAALAKTATDLPIDDVQVLSTFVARTTATPRFVTTLLAWFAAFALLLAGCGLFSVMAYSVAQRRREIGIRMALGAHTADVRALVVRQALQLGVVGLVLGLGGALVIGRLFQTLLFDVSPADPVTLVGVALTLCAVLVVAAYVPARRAVHIDPALALRGD